MKCEYCAGDMSIEDANCPHCGAVNPFYEAHRKDMANYAKRFANTEREVVETTKKFTYKTVVITIISVLVVLNLVMGILLANVRDFTYEMERNKNKKNVDAIAEQMGEYEENEEFVDMFYYNNSILMSPYNTPLYEYDAILRAASYYQDMNATLTDMMGRTYNSSSYYAEKYARNMQRLYETVDEWEKQNEDDERFSDKHKEALQKLIEKGEFLLLNYCNLKEEDLEEFREVSEAKKTIILEERLEEVFTDEE